MVSQFISPDNVGLLGDIPFSFPEGTHAIGRLDSNSEGLLLLTTNKKVTRLLFESKVPHKRTYMVLVQYKVGEESLQKLREGIVMQVKGGVDYLTTPCEVEIEENPVGLPESPIPLTSYIQYTWLRMTLTEGKFHQVRKMVAAVRHRCVRLVRTSIEDLGLDDIPPGSIKELDEDTFFTLLKIDNYK